MRLGSVEIQAARNGYVLFPYGREYYRDGRCIAEAEHYVFADFPSLTVWLKKNIKHGNGVEP